MFCKHGFDPFEGIDFPENLYYSTFQLKHHTSNGSIVDEGKIQRLCRSAYHAVLDCKKFTEIDFESILESMMKGFYEYKKQKLPLLLDSHSHFINNDNTYQPNKKMLIHEAVAANNNNLVSYLLKIDPYPDTHIVENPITHWHKYTNPNGHWSLLNQAILFHSKKHSKKWLIKYLIENGWYDSIYSEGSYICEEYDYRKFADLFFNSDEKACKKSLTNQHALDLAQSLDYYKKPEEFKIYDYLNQCMTNFKKTCNK